MAVGIRPNVELAEGGGPALRPRHRRERHDADVRPAHLRRRRMRGAPRHGLRPRRAAVRDGEGVREPPRAATASAATRARGRRPSSRSPASTCSPRAISSAARAPRTSCWPIPAGGVYKKLVLKDDKLVGAVLYGDTVDGALVLQAAARRPQRRRDPRPAHVRRGEPRRHRPPGPESRALRWPTTPRSAAATACARARSCKAIKDKGLFTLEDVRKHTKASSSCGSCTGLVEQLLMSTAGGDYSARAEEEADVRLHRPHAPGSARRDPRAAACCRSPPRCAFLEWRTPNGCATCRPALNYYLLSTWPHEAQDDPQSRFINERAHANIQKDGTYLGGAAHVGRRDQRLRAAAHRRRRRQVPHPAR